MTLMVVIAPIASGRSVAVKASGHVDGVSGNCNGFVDGWTDWLEVILSPEIVARYPAGMPISMTYSMHGDWPCSLESDSTINISDVIDSGTVTVGTRVYTFAGGTADVLIEPRDEGLFSHVRFDVRYNPAVGQPIELVWYMEGTDICHDGAFSLVPESTGRTYGTLSFAVNVSHDIYVYFSLTDVHEVPEPSTCSLLACLIATGLMARRIRRR